MNAKSCDLANKECLPCMGNVPPLKETEIRKFLSQLEGWETVREHHLSKSYSFPDFASALAFVNRIGELAERVGHHPDLALAWGKVRVEIWTHKIDALTESDFIFAAKVDALFKS